jgi:type IV pilus assembly protein PilE
MSAAVQGAETGRRPCQGFTLVELLSALAIVGILSAIAWPGYSAVIQRAQRNEARFALLQLQQLQERHYATHLRYGARLGTTLDVDTLITPERTAGGHYLLSIIRTQDGQGYTALASAREGGAQARDHHCQRLSIDQTGLRRSADALGNWSIADPHRCWN